MVLGWSGSHTWTGPWFQTAGGGDTNGSGAVDWGAALRVFDRFWDPARPVKVDKSPAFLASGPIIARSVLG